MEQAKSSLLVAAMTSVASTVMQTSGKEGMSLDLNEVNKKMENFATLLFPELEVSREKSAQRMKRMLKGEVGKVYSVRPVGMKPSGLTRRRK